MKVIKLLIQLFSFTDISHAWGNARWRVLMNSIDFESLLVIVFVQRQSCTQRPEINSLLTSTLRSLTGWTYLLEIE